MFVCLFVSSRLRSTPLAKGLKDLIRTLRAFFFFFFFFFFLQAALLTRRPFRNPPRNYENHIVED